MFSIDGHFADIKDLYSVKEDGYIYVLFRNGVVDTYFGEESHVVSLIQLTGWVDCCYKKMLYSEFLELYLIDENINCTCSDENTTLFERLVDEFKGLDRCPNIVLKDYSVRFNPFNFESFDGRVLFEDCCSGAKVEVTNTLKVLAKKIGE